MTATRFLRCFKCVPCFRRFAESMPHGAPTKTHMGHSLILNGMEKGLGDSQNLHTYQVDRVREDELSVSTMHAPTSRARALAVIGLAVLTIGLYAKAMRFDFVSYDDHVYVTQNP